MAHVGIFCAPARGHINPIAALGRALRDRGHRVTVFSIPDAEPIVRGCGLDTHPIAAEDYPLGTMERVNAQLGALSGWKALRLTLGLIMRANRSILERGPAAAREAGVDALLVDQAVGAGLSVADLLGLPAASVACALPVHRDDAAPPPALGWPPWPGAIGRLRNRLSHDVFDLLARPFLVELNRQRRAWGLPPYRHRDDADAGRLRITQLVPSFDFPRPNGPPPGYHYAGPLALPDARPPCPFPYERLTGRPLLYASMGTIQNRLVDTFRAIAEATRGLGFDVVISLGGSTTPQALGRLPGDPIVVAYAPQLDLLRRTHLAITHAGQNTAMECLAAGVPMVALPVTNDQPAVAARIRHSGTGEVLPFHRLRADRLRQRIQRVRDNPSYLRAAERLRHEIAAAGGAPGAAEAFERQTLGRSLS